VQLAEGGEYVIIPRAEYLRLVEASAPEGVPLAEAKAMVIPEMGRRVRLARDAAGITQAALAKRMGLTQAMVSRAESGKVRVTDAYMIRVHKACKLPQNWLPGQSGAARPRAGPKGARSAKAPARARPPASPAPGKPLRRVGEIVPSMDPTFWRLTSPTRCPE
jgi:transcriptional regulator with XRE-family HTH domain